MARRRRRKKIILGLVLLALSAGFFSLGLIALWVATWKLPDLASLQSRKISESTKIYDRTGETLLYDLNAGEKRTVVPYTDISRNIKNATVAIEDGTFWQHRGIRPESFLRAVFVNVGSGSFSQGGSTITQQVVKNSLLTPKKSVSRKLKEWALAWKMERLLSKEDILTLYLNEAPYGGTVYGIEEAAQSFFGKSAGELTLAESAYLAALPNAPTYYSPYGNHRDKLEERKDLVLSRMGESGFISESELDQARRESVAFKPQPETSILAPHFVFFIRQYLEDNYGREVLEKNGLRVITTLDAELQKTAEETVKTYALENKEKFDAENAALVALDPKTGQILAMVGSRDYFDKDIDGNYNSALALRQPGSAFKPFVYAQAFLRGYTPETVVFDTKTEFSTECAPDGTPLAQTEEDICYMPGNYDSIHRGPVSLRDALAQSINIPAIKVLYLAGLRESLRLAKDMGLSTLGAADRYGLTLVLGGGEVRLLDLVSAYGVFATEGVRRKATGVLRIETRDGEVLEEWGDSPERVLDEEVARVVTDILADNRARAPAFGDASPLYFPGRAVAAKTGTTDDYRDAWIVGYTPNLAVGAWAGNNDNRPMQKKVAAFIVAPLWHAFMAQALRRIPDENFTPPAEEDLSSLPPILRGVWQGGETYFVDKLSGARATEFTPPEFREERAVRNIHSILYWIDKNNPRVPRSIPPETDPQFSHWEYGVQNWVREQNFPKDTSTPDGPFDAIHTPEFIPRVSFLLPKDGEFIRPEEPMRISVTITSRFPAAKVHFFINNVFVGSSANAPFSLTLSSADIPAEENKSQLKAVAYDVVGNRGETSISFYIKK